MSAAVDNGAAHPARRISRVPRAGATVHGAGAERELLDRRRLILEQPGVFRLRTPPLPAPWHLAAALFTCAACLTGTGCSTIGVRASPGARRYSDVRRAHRVDAARRPTRPRYAFAVGAAVSRGAEHAARRRVGAGLSERDAHGIRRATRTTRTCCCRESTCRRCSRTPRRRSSPIAAARSAAARR